MGEALLINNTAGSALGLQATDTTLISGVVKAHQYKSVRLQSTIQLAMSASAAARTITLKFKIGSTVIATSTVVTGAGATVGAVTFFEYITNTAAANDSIGAGGTISVTAAGSSADATNTVLTAKNLYVTSVE